MVKSEFIRRVAEDNGYTYDVTHEMLDAIFDTLEKCLTEGHEVIIYGFGSFGFNRKNERVMHNSIFGDMNLPACVGVSFRPCKALKDAVRPLDWDEIQERNKGFHERAHRHGPKDYDAMLKKSRETYKKRYLDKD